MFTESFTTLLGGCVSYLQEVFRIDELFRTELFDQLTDASPVVLCTHTHTQSVRPHTDHPSIRPHPPDLSRVLVSRRVVSVSLGTPPNSLTAVTAPSVSRDFRNRAITGSCEVLTQQGFLQLGMYALTVAFSFSSLIAFFPDAPPFLPGLADTYLTFTGSLRSRCGGRVLSFVSGGGCGLS